MANENKASKASIGGKLAMGFGTVVLIALMGVSAPLLTAIDPASINPSNRNKLPGFEATERDDDGKKVTRIARMGTDGLGRDIYSRVIYGARVSLPVGGTMTRMACGSTIRRIVLPGPIPNAWAASAWPRSTERMPARAISAM